MTSPSLRFECREISFRGSAVEIASPQIRAVHPPKQDPATALERRPEGHSWNKHKTGVEQVAKVLEIVKSPLTFGKRLHDHCGKVSVAIIRLVYCRRQPLEWLIAQVLWRRISDPKRVAERAETLAPFALSVFLPFMNGFAKAVIGLRGDPDRANAVLGFDKGEHIASTAFSAAGNGDSAAWDSNSYLRVRFQNLRNFRRHASDSRPAVGSVQGRLVHVPNSVRRPRPRIRSTQRRFFRRHGMQSARSG